MAWEKIVSSGWVDFAVGGSTVTMGIAKKLNAAK